MARYAALLYRAKARAETGLQKRRIALFELGTWRYMTEGRAKYLERARAPIPAVTVPRVPEASGDATKADWSKAAVLGGTWFDRGQATPAARRLSGRIVHDGTFLYLELTDPCATKKLVSTPTVFPCDDWEIFAAGQRHLPSRQYAVNPSGTVVALSHGEVNWRMNVPIADHGVRAVPDTSRPDSWITRLAVPLKRIVPGGVAPGGTLYMNVLRVSGPALSGTGRLGIDTWVSHCTVHELDRLAEVTLAP
jgi:hypothetical protein